MRIPDGDALFEIAMDLVNDNFGPPLTTTVDPTERLKATVELTKALVELEKVRVEAYKADRGIR